MDFISNQTAQIEEMLKVIGSGSIEELFHAVPRQLFLPRPVLDDGLSEFEGMRHMEELAAKNTFDKFTSYLGAGAYEHHVPALVSAITSRSEFLTAYTPYQPEASQGMLQTIFEFQSAICALTGLDAANASLYDGASAAAESLMMALRLNKNKKRLIVGKSLHPHYRQVVEQYLANQEVELVEAPFLDDGALDLEGTLPLIHEDTAAILLQYPNFFGLIDDIKPVSEAAKKQGALLIISANPLVYGLYASARELGADIAVGDCQPLGLPLHYGGPYAGYIACRQELIRQLPGRIVGETLDRNGKKGYVLTLQAREQHIRREKATSNICTNQALAALASLIAMLWYGKEGMRKLALTNYQRAAYLKDRLNLSISNAPFFNEFAIRLPCPIHTLQEKFRARQIEPGLDLGRFFPLWQNRLLIAVTEVKGKDQLDEFVKVMHDCI